MIVFGIYTLYVYSYHLKREQYIDIQKAENMKSIEVIILPSYYTWNLTPWGDGGIFLDTFKNARGISSDTDIRLVKLDSVQVFNSNN